MKCLVLVLILVALLVSACEPVVKQPIVGEIVGYGWKLNDHGGAIDPYVIVQPFGGGDTVKCLVVSMEVAQKSVGAKTNCTTGKIWRDVEG